MTEETHEDFEEVDWEDGVSFVDGRVDEESRSDQQCSECGQQLFSTMAETDDAGLGPAWVCPACGFVDRI